MRENHPIEGLMLTAMSSIRDMIDVNTIVGEPIEAIEGLLIIPISKVSFGFASGGSEFKEETISEYTKREQEEEIQYKLPFGGGAGAGVSINPVAFLVVQNENVRLIPVEHTSYIDRLLDYVPDLIEKATKFINKGDEKKSEKTERIINQIKKTTKEMSNNENFEVKEFENRTDTNANVIKNTEMYEPKPESDGEDF
ncbi:MAG: sporulation protein YtfJ [Clostridia bacterium]|nr:sporulation protein YtfJ [Clostridia bacterium]